MNPIERYATFEMRCDQLEFELLGHTFACSLHVFDCIGFKIILGMDRLSMILRYFAMIRRYHLDTLVVVIGLCIPWKTLVLSLMFFWVLWRQKTS